MENTLTKTGPIQVCTSEMALSPSGKNARIFPRGVAMPTHELPISIGSAGPQLSQSDSFIPLRRIADSAQYDPRKPLGCRAAAGASTSSAQGCSLPRKRPQARFTPYRDSGINDLKPSLLIHCCDSPCRPRLRSDLPGAKNRGAYPTPQDSAPRNLTHIWPARRSGCAREARRRDSKTKGPPRSAPPFSGLIATLPIDEAEAVHAYLR